MGFTGWCHNGESSGRLGIFSRAGQISKTSFLKISRGGGSKYLQIMCAGLPRFTVSLVSHSCS